MRHRPPLLAPGARVALVAPAGPLRGAADVAAAEANVRGFGWEPVVGEHVLDRDGYFAGRDADRLLDLDRALADDVDAVWCLRGGYGAMRLLERLDYDALRRRPKLLIGFSDITALHAAVGERCGIVTMHGPVARNPLTPFSRDSLERAVVLGTDPCGAAPGARTLRPGHACGRLAGGNLALLAALAGTPYAPDLDGTILVLEDVNEAIYRVDRMLVQLHLSGMLRGVRAIAFGHCTDAPEEADDGARRLDDVLAETADRLGVPCLAGIPVGHIDDQWTIPLGATAVLDADARTLHVEWGAERADAHPADEYDSSVAPADTNQTPTTMPKSAADLIAEAKQRIREVSPQEALAERQSNSSALFVDVREQHEWDAGRVPGALFIPRGVLESQIEQRAPRDRRIVLYCARGNRSALAADTLQQMGYTDVVSMSGGFQSWVDAGGDVER